MTISSSLSLSYVSAITASIRSKFLKFSDLCYSAEYHTPGTGERGLGQVYHEYHCWFLKYRSQGIYPIERDVSGDSDAIDTIRWRDSFHTMYLRLESDHSP